MRSLKISIVGSRGIPATYGGIEKTLEEICPRLAQRGHQVSVYSRPDATYSKDSFKGVRINRVPAINTKHLETFTRVVLSLWQEMFSQSDIVHFHALGPATFSGIPRLFSKKTVVTVHGLGWKRKKWGWLARQILKVGEYASAKFPDATIVVSPFLHEYYNAKYGIQTTFIPNGVNMPEPKEPNLIRQHGLTQGNYILFVSRLVPEKGCHYLIEAFKELDTDMKLVIAGSSSHTDAYVKQLHALSRDRSDIVFTGFVSGELLVELFSNAYLYVLPSEIEGLSISLLEAMSYRLCVVTSDIPENISVTQGTHGYSFRSQDVNHLREVLAHLLQQPEKVKLTGQKACEYVSKHYGWDSITEQIEALYYSLIEEK